MKHIGHRSWLAQNFRGLERRIAMAYPELSAPLVDRIVGIAVNSEQKPGGPNPRNTLALLERTLADFERAGVTSRAQIEELIAYAEAQEPGKLYAELRAKASRMMGDYACG